nr:immunoglobulin light chain junction region [Macaca mulatta]
CLQALQTPCTF